MIKEVKYKVLTDEEAIRAAIRTNLNTLRTIADLREWDTFTVSYPITMTVDINTAKRIAKEYLNENSNYR